MRQGHQLRLLGHVRALNEIGIMNLYVGSGALGSEGCEHSHRAPLPMPAERKAK
jgi:uncharacterized protein (DUF111 family)